MVIGCRWSEFTRHLLSNGMQIQGFARLRSDISLQMVCLRRRLSQQRKYADFLADLEVYNVKTDGWGLIALAGVLVSISSAVAWPREPLKLPADGDWGNSVSSTTADAEAEEPPAEISKRIGNAIVAVTIFHHVTTAFGAWDFYKRDSHYSTSMSIGVWANVFLTAVGTLSFL